MLALLRDASMAPGWKHGKSGYVDPTDATDEVFRLSKEIGHPPKPNKFLDQDDPSRFNASHAEKQLAATRPNQPIAVSREMCDDCIEWFQKLAQHRQQVQVVADPRCVRVFRPDGRIVEIPR